MVSMGATADGVEGGIGVLFFSFLFPPPGWGIKRGGGGSNSTEGTERAAVRRESTAGGRDKDRWVDSH